MAEPIPAAQYLRMSTEHQQYSLENQSTAIQKYAQAHDFEVVRTYSDAAKSGVVLRHRKGLQQLLKDVVGGAATYAAILVYDVSRWGRFQDTDESAHYEFLCKSSGVPVHYCAETFGNDGTLPNLIMKALKRTMAGEYSRELGVKVLAGQKRLAQQGFKQGGSPGYGLRRLLVSAAGVPKQQLAVGERKSIATDRVTLIPGPDAEVQCVRDIFQMLIFEKQTVYGIARKLNRDGTKFVGGADWDYQAVYKVLTHPKYAGCHVFGKTSRKLHTPSVPTPQSEWIITPGAIAPIVTTDVLEAAQQILRARTFNKSDDEIIAMLRELLASKGKLSLKLIKETPGIPSPSTYRWRFGGLRKAYELAGYGRTFCSLDVRSRTYRLRESLLAQIESVVPGSRVMEGSSRRCRSTLLLGGGLQVSLLLARSKQLRSGAVRWVVDPVKRERTFFTILARLDLSNSDVKDFWLLPRNFLKARKYLRPNDSWLKSAKLIKQLSQLAKIIQPRVV